LCKSEAREAIVKKLEPLAGGVLPWFSLATMVAALAMIFLYAPTERTQGIVQRIFYFHLSCALMAFLGFLVVAVAGGFYLRRSERLTDHVARAAAEVGMLFCTLVLITGPIWARPIWGVWWTWDPRLTMTLILWTIYAAYVLLRLLGRDSDAVARYAAVLGIVGALDIPVIYVSVRLWRGIHPNVKSMDPAMAATLMVCSVAFLATGLWMFWMRLQSLVLEDEVASVRQRLFTV